MLQVNPDHARLMNTCVQMIIDASHCTTCAMAYRIVEMVLTKKPVLKVRVFEDSNIVFVFSSS